MSIRKKITAFSPLAVAALAALLLAACEKEAPQQQKASSPKVNYVTIKYEAVPSVIQLPGRASAYLLSDVRPQVNGIIQRRLFTEGDMVKAGDVLYQIDPLLYQAAVDNAKASLMKAEANLVSARLLAERYAQVVKVNAVSRQDYDNAKAAYGQAKADVASAKAALDSAQINLGYTKVTAPVSGRIGISTVTPGQLVTANQQNALTTVQQTDPMYIDVTQSSTDLLRLKKDLASGRIKSSGPNQTEVRLIMEDGTEYPHKGTLQFTDITVDKSTGSITIRATFPNPDDLILPGSYVRVVRDEGINEKAVLVPQQAVLRDAMGMSKVLLVDKDGKLESRSIKTGQAIGNRWLVESGLNQDDKVIVDGLQSVQNLPVGAALQAEPMAEKAAGAAQAPQQSGNAAAPAPEAAKTAAPAKN